MNPIKAFSEYNEKFATMKSLYSNQAETDTCNIWSCAISAECAFFFYPQLWVNTCAAREQRRQIFRYEHRHSYFEKSKSSWNVMSQNANVWPYWLHRESL